MNDEAHAKRRTFRTLLERSGCTVMVGGFSPIYARLAETIGFEAFFVSGSQMSAFLLGVPDNGIIGLRDVVDHVRHIAARTTLPIFVDADTGFGNAVNVHYTVGEIVRSGVAGLQIEDQEAPLKSGNVGGRSCISLEEMVGKVRAAVAARDELDPAFVIAARSDAIGAAGETYDTALERAVAYARDGHADLVWMNGLSSPEQVARACAAIPAPVMTIWAGGKPVPSAAEFAALGLRIVLYPTLLATIGLEATWHVLNDFHRRGAPALDDFNASFGEAPWGRVDRGALIEAARVGELEAAFVSKPKS